MLGRACRLEFINMFEVCSAGKQRCIKGLQRPCRKSLIQGSLCTSTYLTMVSWWWETP